MLPFGDQTSKSPGNKSAKIQARVGRDVSCLGGGGSNFYCRLRMYNSLRQGKFNVRARKTSYTPFKLRVDFREIGGCLAAAGGSSDEGSKSPDSQCISGCDGLQSVILIITAIPITTSYSELEQVRPIGGTYMTRHSADCTFTKVKIWLKITMLCICFAKKLASNLHSAILRLNQMFKTCAYSLPYHVEIPRVP